MDKKTDKPKSILVTRFSALGDVAMAVPVVYSVCRDNPGVRLVFVTKKATQGLFVNPPENLVVIGVDLKNDYSGTYGLWKLLKQMRSKYDIEAVADLHGVLRTFAIGLMARFSGLKFCSIRKGRKGKRSLPRARNKVMLPLLSSRARYREVFYRLGLSVEYSFNSIYGQGKASPDLFADITPPKEKSEKWVGIAPFARHNGKIYPHDLMKVVVDEIASLPGVKVFLFGAGPSVERGVAGRPPLRFSSGTCFDEPSGHYAYNGFWQYAHGLVGWSACNKRVGCNTPVLRIQGFPSIRYGHDTAAYVVPSVLGVR